MNLCTFTTSKHNLHSSKPPYTACPDFYWEDPYGDSYRQCCDWQTISLYPRDVYQTMCSYLFNSQRFSKNFTFSFHSFVNTRRFKKLSFTDVNEKTLSNFPSLYFQIIYYNLGSWEAEADHDFQLCGVLNFITDYFLLVVLDIVTLLCES